MTNKVVYLDYFSSKIFSKEKDSTFKVSLCRIIRPNGFVIIRIMASSHFSSSRKIKINPPHGIPS